MQQMIRERIESYYKQLTTGCGHTECTNKQCASSPNFQHKEKNTNDLAAYALQVRLSLIMEYSDLVNLNMCH